MRARHAPALLATLALTFSSLVVLAPPAAAALHNPIPMTSDEEPSDTFTTADALFVYVTADIKGGTVCIVKGDVQDPADASCDRPAWGSPNFIVGIGSIIQPIQGPYLKPGTWQLLTEDENGKSIALSVPFTVTACEPGACDRTIGLDAVQKWKDVAKSNQVGAEAYCSVQKLKGRWEEEKEKYEKARAVGEWAIAATQTLSILPAPGSGLILSLPDFSNPAEQKGMEILEELSCAVSNMYGDIVADPADPAFATVEAPVVGSVTPLGAAETDALAAAMARQHGYAGASLTAFERYLGAVAAGNDAGVVRQARATSDFTHDLVNAVLDSADALDAYAARADAVPELTGPLAASDADFAAALALRARVATEGFTAAEIDQLHALGVTDMDIAALRQRYGSPSVGVTAQTTVSDQSRALAATLRDSTAALDAFSNAAAAVAAQVVADDTTVPTGQAPVASFTATPAGGAAPLTVAVDASASHDPDGTIVTYEWDFGDGATGSGKTTSHTFAAGPSTITLTVRDNDGLTASATHAINSGGPAPVNKPPMIVVDPGDFTADEGAAPAIQFTATDPDGSVVGYRWTLPDGRVVEGAGPPALPDDGDQTLVLTVTDDEGATTSVPILVHGINVAPRLEDWDYSPRSVPGATTRFVGANSDPGVHDDPSTVWDFGDGTSATGSNVEHRFLDAGVYQGTVVVRDKDGAESDPRYFTVTVEPLRVDAGPAVQGDEGSEVDFEFWNSTQEDAFLTYAVDYGDGTPVASTTIDGRHVYSTPGTYTVTLTGTDRIDAHAAPTVVTRTTTAVVHNVDPTIHGVATSAFSVGRPSGLNALWTDPGGAPGAEVSWVFDDGTTATGSTLEHRFTAAGTHTATVTVTDGEGGAATRTVHIDVAPTAPPVSHSSGGRDFWIDFDANHTWEAPPYTRYLHVYAAGPAGTTGTVDVPGIGFATEFTIPTEGIATVDVPIEALVGMDATDPVRIEPRAIHVAADADVTVYGLNRAEFTTDAYLALPTTAAGTRFRVTTYESITAGLLSVVAAQGTTHVHVEPPASSDEPPFDATLELGEVLEWEPKTNTAVTTGTVVTSDLPISVFSGNRCTDVPRDITACDHVIEQMAPTDTWGKTFVTYPLFGRTQDTFRVLADRNGTHVHVEAAGGAHDYTLQAGEYVEFLSGEAQTITADLPISVAQFSNGSSFDDTVSDPFMVMVAPYEQGFTESTFATPEEGFSNYVNITAPTSSRAGVRLDGHPVDPTLWHAVPGSAYSGAAVTIDSGAHTLTSPDPVLTVVYGFADWDSYGYAGGTRLAAVADVQSLTLDPAHVAGSVGDALCTVAAVRDAAGTGVPGVRVDVTLDGVVADSRHETTGADGTLPICATSSTAGSTTVTAAVAEHSTAATLAWDETVPANLPPVAVLATPAIVNEGGIVHLDATGSFDPDGTPLLFAWDTDGDGATDDGTGATLDLPAKIAGAFTVVVRVIDADGASASASVQVVVGNVVPVVAMTVPARVPSDGALSGHGSFTDPGADRWTATVDYGDGGAPRPLALTGTSFDLAHTYSMAGTYTVTVRVSDETGGSTGSATSTVQVDEGDAPTDHAPTISGLVDMTVSEGTGTGLHVSAQDPDGTLVIVTWELTGLGSDTCTLEPDFADATLTCTDDAVVTVTATVGPPPFARPALADLFAAAAPATAAVSAQVTVLNASPVVDAVSLDPAGVRTRSVSAVAPFTDAGTGDTWTCALEVDSIVVAGTVDDSDCLADIGPLAAGPHAIIVEVTDDDGGVGRSSTQLVVSPPVDEPTPTPTPTSVTPTPTHAASQVLHAGDPTTSPTSQGTDSSSDVLSATGSDSRIGLLLAVGVLLLGLVLLALARRQGHRRRSS